MQHDFQRQENTEIRQDLFQKSPRDFFLTSTFHQQKQKIVYIPHQDQITETFNKIDSTINGLDQRVTDILKKKEDKYLQDYKEQMYKVQREMKILNDKADDQESKNRRDQRVRQLVQQRDSFRNEAIRLDEMCKDTKLNVEKLKNKKQKLEDDNKFLDSQIQSAKKQNELLKQQLQQQQKIINESKEVSQKVQQSLEEDPMKNYSLDSQFMRNLNLSQEQNSQIQERRYNQTIGHLKNQLEAEKRLLKQLKSSRTNYYTEKSEMEEQFLECLQQVQQQICKRKNQSIEEQNQQNVRFEAFTDIDKRQDIMQKSNRTPDTKGECLKISIRKAVSKQIIINKSKGITKFETLEIHSDIKQKNTFSKLVSQKQKVKLLIIYIYFLVAYNFPFLQPQ